MKNVVIRIIWIRDDCAVLIADADAIGSYVLVATTSAGTSSTEPTPGNTLLIGLSGSGTSGFPVGGKVIPLTFDNFTLFGLAFIKSFSATVDNQGQATTPPFRWPAIPAGLPLYYCGVTLDNTGIVSITEPFKFLSRP